MSDRLQELLRQRALVQQHLAWLDGEIAKAQGGPAATPPAAPRQLPPAPRPAPPPQGYVASQAAALARHAATAPAPSTSRSDENPHVAAAADAILSEYRVEPDSLKTDVRKGCFLYFFGALAFVALVVTGLYYALSARPH
jgi:hypothetical protein